MSTLRHLFTSTLCVGSFSLATAQLVFVQDTNLRAYLDSVIPGVVDANGYIDSSGPLALGVTELTINFDWTPADITGIEAFSNLEELHLMNDGGVIPLTINSLPENLELLEVYYDFAITSLPPFPNTLESLWLWTIYDLTVLPAFPQDMYDLVLIQLMDVAVIPAVPDTLHLFGVSECVALQAITNMPEHVWSMELSALPLSTLPDCPQTVENEISLEYFNNLTTLPQLPTSVGADLELRSLPLIDSIPALPDSCPMVHFRSMQANVHLGNLPQNLTDLDIREGGPGCVPLLPVSLEQFQCEMCAVECLPNLVAGADHIWDFNFIDPAQVPVCNLLNTSCASVTNAIVGRVFTDHNSNGSYDPGEAGCPLANIQTLPGNCMSGVGQAGEYALGVSPGAYTLSCAYAHPYATSVSPSQHFATFAGWDGLDTLNDFVVTLQPNVQDIVTDLTFTGLPVPGFDCPLTLTVLNSGTTQQDVSLTFTCDVGTMFISSVPPPDLVNGNVLTWNFIQMNVGQQTGISMLIHTPVGTPLGTLVTHTAIANPVSTDQTPINNSYTSTTAVVGSWDPNDKAVSPTALTPAQVAAEERLTYTIRFQNTGTWPATRVVLTDTLSTDLQWNSMQEIAASHAHTWFISNGVLHVVFDNIMLPDSNANEPESHGFFKFSMKPVSTLLLGDAVSNTANIYFDFNEPVITNAAVFTVDNNVAVAEAPSNGVHLSPNPASDVLAVELTGTASNQVLEVVDVTGRTVLRAVTTGTRTLLDVHALKAGSYHVHVGDGIVGRFVKR